MKKVFILSFVILLFPQFSNASCGLRGCPLPKPFKALFDLTGLGGEISEGGFDASYFSTTLRTEYRPVDPISLAFNLPFGVASYNGSSHSGILDISLEATARLFQVRDAQDDLWLGVQFEFPTGDEDNFLGAGHYGALPFVTYRSHFHFGMLYAQTGLRLAINEHDHGASAPPIDGSVFDPHSGKEWVYRIGINTVKVGPIEMGLAFAGQTIIEEEEQGTTFLSLHPDITIPFNDQWSANIKGEFPVTSDQRFDWRAGAGISYIF